LHTYIASVIGNVDHIEGVENLRLNVSSASGIGSNASAFEILTSINTCRLLHIDPIKIGALLIPEVAVIGVFSVDTVKIAYTRLETNHTYGKKLIWYITR